MSFAVFLRLSQYQHISGINTVAAILVLKMSEDSLGEHIREENVWQEDLPTLLSQQNVEIISDLRKLDN